MCALADLGHLVIQPQIVCGDFCEKICEVCEACGRGLGACGRGMGRGLSASGRGLRACGRGLRRGLFNLAQALLICVLAPFMGCAALLRSCRGAVAGHGERLRLELLFSYSSRSSSFTVRAVQILCNFV